MIGRLALRSLTAHPIRSAVLAAGFGTGVAVMAILLGVADIVLQQASSPALVGGGDVLIRLAPQVPAQMVLSGTLQSGALAPRVRTAAPWHRASLYLVRDDGSTVEVDARGGVPSLERALGDVETAGIAAWRDAPEDAAWVRASPDVALRQLDRFHPIPDAPTWADSWAEWLYFNGRAGDTRFYLTFLVGPRLPDGSRPGGVRLQLDRGGAIEAFTTSARLTDAEIASAPDLTIGSSRVRLDGLTYRIDLDLVGASGERVTGTLAIAGSAGRLVPPLEITGAKGWRSGYVVPVMSGTLSGALDVGGTPVSLENGSGYHDHNWGFWQGVSWQWGQVQQGDLSFLYGRVFPPPEAADASRVPGFVGALGPDGPLGYATNVTIVEENDATGKPTRITVRGIGSTIDLTLRFDVGSLVTTGATQGPLGGGNTQLNFLQMRGSYAVNGTAAGKAIGFTAPGSAETFRDAALTRETPPLDVARPEHVEGSKPKSRIPDPK